MALVLLAACARPVMDTGAFRTASAPIYSNASLDIGRMTGRWAEVATFAAPGSTPCGPAGVEIVRDATGLTISGALCLSGRRIAVNGPLAPAGTGRFRLPGADPRGIGQVWWVLWVDTGYRTLIVGTPSGDFGFILNRDGALPSDRGTAARDVLDFNGYDVGRMVVVPVAG